MLYILFKCLGRGWFWGDGDFRLVFRFLVIIFLGIFLGWVLEYCDEIFRGGGGFRYCFFLRFRRVRIFEFCALCLIYIFVIFIYTCIFLCLYMRIFILYFRW